MTNPDEQHICELVKSIPLVYGRYATREEDCGNQKADVVVKYEGETFYFQVSHTPKSKKEQEKLLKRGTLPISTHKYKGMPIPEDHLIKSIKEYINYK